MVQLFPLSLLLLCSILEADKKVPSKLDCQFETGLCHWRSVDNVWERRGSSPYQGQGPAADHTPGQGEHFLLMSTEGRGPKAITATLTSQPVSTSSVSCLTFWYYMHGDEVFQLEVVRLEVHNLSGTGLLTLGGKQSPRWFQAAVDLDPGDFMISIRGKYVGVRGTGDIAIDDVAHTNDGPCPMDEIVKNQPSLDCDFEEDNLCSWYNGHGRGPWQRGWQPHSKGRSMYVTTPPKTGGKQFIDFWPESYEEDGYLALVSPVVLIREPGACMSFWYTNQGYHRTSFSVKIINIRFTSDGPSEQKKKVLKLHHKANDRVPWSHAVVSLPPANYSFIKIQLNYIPRYDRNLYAGIDKIKVDTSGQCGTEHMNRVIGCDFENDTCLWSAAGITSGESEWIRGRGPTPAEETGPSSDHTTGDGYYLYSNATYRRWARLVSPGFNIEHGACFTFWYYMYGEDVASLSLYEANEGLLWSVRGDQGDQWHQHHVSLNASDQVNLLFSARRALFPRDDIALDDFSFSMGDVCEEDRSITLATTQSLSTPRSPFEPEGLETPVLTIQGDISPALVNSRVEVQCGMLLEGVLYQWFKRHNDEFQLFEGQTNRTLVFEKIRMEDASSYMCRVIKDKFIDSDSRTIEIEVEMVKLPSPQVTTLQDRDPIYQNSRVELRCSHPPGIDTELTGLTYKWVKVQDASSPVTVSKESRHVFQDILLKDAGKYQCVMSKPDFNDGLSKMIDLHVVKDPRPAPTLKANVTSYPQTVNEKYVLECGAEDSPRAEYHWVITSEAFASSVPSTRVIVINNSQPVHSGNYSCRVTKDDYSTAKSNTLKLKVVPGKRCDGDYQCRGSTYRYRYPCQDDRCQCQSTAVVQGQACVRRPAIPAISVWPKYTEFKVGETFYLVCNAKGPMPSRLFYAFKKNEEILSHTDLSRFYIHKIAKATEEDSGRYSCFTSDDDNVTSFDSESIAIKVKEHVDLNCDFNHGTVCHWSPVHGEGMGTFTFRQDSRSNNRYIQLDPLENRGENETKPTMASLRTPQLDKTEHYSCLNFRFRMHGPDVYSLSVWKYTGQSMRRRLWLQVGDQGDGWRFQHVTIPHNDPHLQIQLEAIGDVAIDDVVFKYRGECEDV